MSENGDSDNESGDFEAEFEQDEIDLTTIDIPGIKPELRRLYAHHPELIVDYIETVLKKVPLKNAQPSGNKDNVNYDVQHKTYPFLTIYERTKIIGLRANQLSQGARPFISIPEQITDVRDIARLELAQKKLPFIVKRPLPNGTFEYWRLVDLMIL
jgi:DNA-directed RNA polymerase I, II, and III subunit RPABC2